MFHYMGVSRNVCQWISNFLRNKTQREAYHMIFFVAIPVSSGIIQGSVLGPILFTGFITDFPQTARSYDVLMFADDAKAIGVAKNVCDCIMIHNDLT